jgi:DNA repair exonuclease SbcCD ATPase subunit
MAEKPETKHKIVRLETENVKRIQAVSIRPDGNIVEITGKNGHGKTSLLDSIWLALGGVKDAPSKPVRKGEKKAITEIETDNGLIIRRTFISQDDGTFTTGVIVETTDGMRAAKPQEMLDKLVGSLSFDPFAFVRMKEKDQFDILKRFVPDFDFKAEAETRKKAFDARTEENRRLKDLRAVAADIKFPDDTPDEEVSVTALADEIQKINDENAAIERRRNNRETVKADAERLEADAERLQAHAKSLRQQADEAEALAGKRHDDAKALRDQLENAEPLPKKRDITPIREKMADAESINVVVRRKKQKADLAIKIADVETEAAALTKAIEESDDRKKAAIAAAKIPVDGIGFGDDEILLNGFPFVQASTAEQLRAAVQLAMASAPRFRVILVRDASLLDEESMKMMHDMAVEYDFQLWLEVVSSDNQSAIVIEDGMVKGAEKVEASE